MIYVDKMCPAIRKLGNTYLTNLGGLTFFFLFFFFLAEKKGRLMYSKRFLHGSVGWCGEKE